MKKIVVTICVGLLLLGTGAVAFAAEFGDSG